MCNFCLAKAQILNPVKWSYGSKRLSATEGVVFLKATMEDGWHIYSQTVPANGPGKTSFVFAASKLYTLVGNTQEPKPITRFEKVFGFKVAYFEDSVIFQQKVKLNAKGPVTITGSLEFQTCDDEKCIQPVQVPFSVTIK
jgi:DsbC/DsbD-like thiol-disulfide interchange protein